MILIDSVYMVRITGLFWCVCKYMCVFYIMHVYIAYINRYVDANVICISLHLHLVVQETLEVTELHSLDVCRLQVISIH